MTNLFDRLPLALRARFARSSVVSRQSSVAMSEQHPQQLTTDHGLRTFRRSNRRDLRGLTLIEMLVALAVTLVMMAAVVNLFANISGSIRNRRAAIETGAQLRQVRQRLAMDLNGATCRGTTWQRPEANQGYIEIIEGECSDKSPTLMSRGVVGAQIDPAVSTIPSSQKINPDAGILTDAGALGDYDDVLALTVQSDKAPFVAQVGGAMVESSLAEVVWFATENQPGDPGELGMRKVYRRVLLIAPWLNAFSTNINDPPNNVSAHWDPSRNGGTGQWVANTLGDLTKRENRATRRGNSAFPHSWDPHSVPGDPNHNASAGVYNYNRILPGNTSVDALVLTNALAFDLRVFDPGAPLYDNAGTIVEPSDLGWDAAYGFVVDEASDTFFDDFVSQGAYVDMGYGAPVGLDGLTLANRPPPAPQPIRPVFAYQSMLAGNGGGSNYDTWSYHYENDGIDQDPGNATMPNIIDQGANGLDDDGINGVDDMGERETRPPYDVPLRGIKAILRVYEPDARQIRESSVTHSFRQ